jgi:D-alanyl-D-alanine dipeptidase
MLRRTWDAFEDVVSQSHVADLISQPRTVAPQDLVAMKTWRKGERVAACGGRDPIRIVLAYAQDELVYAENGKAVALDDAALYAKIAREKKLNKFGLAYRRDAEFWLNKPLADIVVGAAIRLYQTEGWTTVLYDGLRTVEGAYNLHRFATDQDLSSGLLALPGQSAHNKGLAVDSMMEDERGEEVDMGGHFDHLDMTTNARTYDGNAISDAAKRNRIIREAAFLYAAFTQDLLIAPLRTEFWDDRPPENRADLWRVLDAAARCVGIRLLSEEDEKRRKTDRSLFRKQWEEWTYQTFLARWQDTFKGREREAEALFGAATPPQEERVEFYHGNYHPIYDRDLKASGKHLTQALVDF